MQPSDSPFIISGSPLKITKITVKPFQKTPADRLPIYVHMEGEQTFQVCLEKGRLGLVRENKTLITNYVLVHESMRALTDALLQEVLCYHRYQRSVRSNPVNDSGFEKMVEMLIESNRKSDMPLNGEAIWPSLTMLVDQHKWVWEDRSIRVGKLVFLATLGVVLFPLLQMLLTLPW